MSDQPSSPTEATTHRSPKHEEQAATSQASPTSVEPIAPHDPQAAGAASDQQRALLQANVSGSQQKGAVEEAAELAKDQPGGTAGVHSTGSYTGTSHSNPQK
jgi:hypothetical protein